MSKKTYYEKLKDPRWQKKRLEILSREKFKCQGCSNVDNNQLHAHHCYYEPDTDPWDYPDSCFLSLCEKCHKEIHEQQITLAKILSQLSPALYRMFVDDLAHSIVSGERTGTVYDVISFAHKKQNHKQ